MLKWARLTNLNASAVGMRMDGIYRRRNLEEWEGQLHESVESGDGSEC